MEIGYCDSTTDRDELHLPEKVPGMDYQCEDGGIFHLHFRNVFRSVISYIRFTVLQTDFSVIGNFDNFSLAA